MNDKGTCNVCAAKKEAGFAVFAMSRINKPAYPTLSEVVSGIRLLTLCSRRGKNYVVFWTRSPLQPHSTTRQPQLDMGLARVPLGCTPKSTG